MSDTVDPCDESALRALYPAPSRLAIVKQIDRLDEHCRRFISMSPFLVIGSTRPGRGTDVSPRGDAPGFVRVLDERTLAIPDRPGNNRLDTMSNLLAEAQVGLLFLVPGLEETLRVNGTASLSRDPQLLEGSTVMGKLPRMMILVAVREVFYHCGKAIKRARLWQEDYRVDPKSVPSLGRVIVEQARLERSMSVEEADAAVERSYKQNLY
ncbi:MAG TPA: pyridoxamine 5'-phosphate oxidase family protein [Stellaceae bacterium]|nr:pyridoxamine 5'-phosphate oxidase family protein [Stellaceae bacterium]